MVAGEPLRRVGAPTPRLLRSPPLAKVQSHSHHLLRQVLFAYLAVPPCLVRRCLVFFWRWDVVIISIGVLIASRVWRYPLPRYSKRL